MNAYNNLMDKELEESEVTKIREIISQDTKIKGYHMLKTRRSGSRIFIQFHAEIDKDLPFYSAHKIADNLEHNLLSTFTNAEVIIHQDPV